MGRGLPGGIWTLPPGPGEDVGLEVTGVLVAVVPTGLLKAITSSSNSSNTRSLVDSGRCSRSGPTQVCLSHLTLALIPT